MTSNAISKSTTKGFCFKKTIITDPVNHSGGIWVCWNYDNIHVVSHVLSDRCVHLNALYKPTNEHFLVYGAYFPAQNSDKDPFWESMALFYDNITIPWILLGDFNELLSPNDKLGGNLVSRSQCQRLPSFLTRTNAMDIHCLQQDFSWKSNSHPGLYHRLDRAVASHSFNVKFPLSIVRYGTFTSADHAPMFFESKSSFEAPNGLFRFQNSWTLEEGALRIVKKNWNTNIQGTCFHRIRTKLSNIKCELKTWVKDKYTFKTIKLKPNAEKIVDLKEKLMVKPFNIILQNHLACMLKQREKMLVYSQHVWKSFAKKN